MLDGFIFKISIVIIIFLFVISSLLARLLVFFFLLCLHFKKKRQETRFKMMILVIFGYKISETLMFSIIIIIIIVIMRHTSYNKYSNFIDVQRDLKRLLASQLGINLLRVLINRFFWAKFFVSSLLRLRLISFVIFARQFKDIEFKYSQANCTEHVSYIPRDEIYYDDQILFVFSAVIIKMTTTAALTAAKTTTIIKIIIQLSIISSCSVYYFS